MYTIALCDDEEAAFQQVERLLALYQDTAGPLDCQMQHFRSGEALLEWIESGGCMPDLLLLDIFMSGKTGIEVAQDIRSCGGKMPIIFQTVSKEYALNAYEVDAIQYLIKPLEQEKFFHAMDIAFGQIRKREGRENEIFLKLPGGVRRLRPNEIIYCESRKNYQIVYLEKEECRIRMTARELWEILEKSPQFGRCGRSFILNMNHIVSIRRELVLMDNDLRVYVPKNKTAELRRLYFEFCFVD